MFSSADNGEKADRDAIDRANKDFLNMMWNW